MATLLRRFVLTSGWLVGITSYAEAQDHPALTLTIIPTTYATPLSPTAAISLAGDAHFHVLLTNISGKPVLLFQEWNSWGYFGLSFDITYSDGHKARVYKADRPWAANFPATLTLAPKGVYVFDVDLGKTWVNSPRTHPNPKSAQGLACRLQATYAIAPTYPKSALLSRLQPPPWTGTVRSAELPYLIWL